jgi:hypothetical protein
VVATRNAIFAALTDAGIYTPMGPDLSVMARFTATLFQAPPIMAELSETLSDGSIAPARVARARPAAVKPSAPTPAHDDVLRQLGHLSRYRKATGTAPRGVAATEAAAAPRPAKVYVNLANRRAGDIAEARSGERHIRLHDGGYALWQVPSSAETHVAAQAGAPIRITTFDAYMELLDDQIVPADGSLRLPDGTAALAVQHAAHLTQAESRLVGWTRRTELLQANRARFVGDGFTVKPHGEPRFRRRGRIQRHGTMDGATMLRRNATRRGPGWVETSFFAEMQTFVVTVRGGGPGTASAAVEVQRRTPHAATPYASSAPVATIRSREATLLVYAFGPAPDGKPYRVLVRCREGWILEGCHAWNGRAADFKDALPGLQPLIGGMVIGTEPTEAVARLSVAPQSNRSGAVP